MPDYLRPSEPLHDSTLLTMGFPTHLASGGRKMNGGILMRQGDKCPTVNIRPPKWTDNNFWIRAENYQDAQYIADAVYYYVGHGPFHFCENVFEYPPLRLSTCELSTREACSAYVKSIAKGKELQKQREDYRERVKELALKAVKSPEVVLFLSSFRKVAWSETNIEATEDSEIPDDGNGAASFEDESHFVGVPAEEAADNHVGDEFTEQGTPTKVDDDGLSESSQIQGRSRLCKVIQDKIGEQRQDESHGVRVVGLYGMGGIGKTTICKALCDEFYTKFHGKVCHVEFGRVSEEELLREVVKKLSNTSHDYLNKFNRAELEYGLHQGVIEDAVFLALDNVSHTDASSMQAKNYLSARVPPGSIVLVTARARDSLTLVTPYLSDNNCMKMPELKIEEAKSLFIKSSDFEPRSDDDDQLINRCIERCRFFKADDDKSHHYHPLALDVLGKQLGSIDREEWKARLDKIDEDIFNQTKENNHPIFSALRTSFDSLASEDQLLFMDSALRFSCIFSEDTLQHCQWLGMVHGLPTVDVMIALKRLKRKSLLERVGDGTKIAMHDLWREFCVKEAGQRWVFGMDRCSELVETSPSSLADLQIENPYYYPAGKRILIQRLRHAEEAVGNDIGGSLVIPISVPKSLRFQKGGSARVCRATWLGEKVIRKVFMSTCSATQQLQQELDNLNRLYHPVKVQNMVGLSVCSKEQAQIVMELMDADLVVLKSRLRDLIIEPSTIREGLQNRMTSMLLQIAEGVNKRLNKRNLVHRDLKALNIFVPSIFSLVQEQRAKILGGSQIPDSIVGAASCVLNDVEPARKRFRARNWSADEIRAMFELTGEAAGVDVVPDWDNVSENLWEIYGYDRSSNSCENLWGTLLQSYRAMLVHESMTRSDFENSIGVVGTGFWRAPEILKAIQKHTLDTMDERSKNKWNLDLGLRDRTERILIEKPPLKETKSIEMDADRRFQSDLGHLDSADCDEVLYHDLTDSKIEGDPQCEDEGLSGDSTATIESQAEDRADSHVPRAYQSHQPTYETISNIAGRNRSTATVMEDDLILRIAPFVNKQIDDALKPLLYVLRSREEEERKHREKVLAILEEKLALKREKMLFTHRVLTNSNAFRTNRQHVQHECKLGKDVIK